LWIKDNLIVLNHPETGDGVTLGVAGVQIDRGTAPPANMVWEEATQAFTFITGEVGNLNRHDSVLQIRSIKTDPFTDHGNLTLIGSGTGIISVAGTTDYELNVTNDDDIPNKKYVDSKIINSPGHSISSDDSYVYVADKDITPGEPGSPEHYRDLESPPNHIESSKSAVSIVTDKVLAAQFYADKAVIRNVEIKSDEGNAAVITNRNDGGNLYFKTATTGKLQTNYAIQLTQHAVVPSPVSNATLIYADEPKGGGTGLYFVNNSNKPTDELVSKKRALLYSMIF